MASSEEKHATERTALLNPPEAERGVVNADEEALNKLGYGQQLSRTLGFFSMFGFAFKFLSPVVGVYSMFGVGLSTAGPQFIWILPYVVVGQLMVVFVFSELAVRFPIAGAMYEWTRHLVGPRFGWVVGWIYLWALLITTASMNLGGVPYLLEIFGLQYDPSQQLWIPVVVGAGFNVLQFLINVFGVHLTTYLTSAGLVVEISMTVVLGVVLLFVPGPHQPFSIFLSSDTAAGMQGLSSLLPASLAFAYVFYGFETAAIVSEETQNAQREAPRSMIAALLGAGVVTAFLDFALIRGIPDMNVATNPANTENVIPYILQAHFGNIVMRILSGLLTIAFLSAGAAGQAAAARIIFSYARDDMIPGSSFLKVVTEKTHIPTNATIVAAIVPILVMCSNFVAFNNFSMLEVLVTYSVIGIYTSFQLVVFGRLFAACTKPALFADDSVDAGYFNLRWASVPVAVLALLYGVTMIVNLAWPRAQPGQPEWTAFVPIISTTAVVIIGVLLSVVVVKREPSVANVGINDS